jgi:hypothetical protein
LRRARELDRTFPTIVFVHPSTPEDGEAHFAERWPEVASIADPKHALYTAFGLGRGTLLQVLGPRVWLAGLRAVGRGNGVGRVKGDPLLMSGAFLVRAGFVVWGHHSAHSGDIVDPATVPRSGGASS